MKILGIIMLIIYGLFQLGDLCWYAYMHGKTKTNDYNFWTRLIATIISIGFFILLIIGLGGSFK